MCRTHLLADEDFGKEKMGRHRRRTCRDAKTLDVVSAVGVDVGAAQTGLRAQWRPPG